MTVVKTYQKLKKPSWAPPGWLFGPVWTVLYLLILVSFNCVFFLYTHHNIGFLVLLPFIINLIVNLLFTPLQFGLHNTSLATVDTLLILLTLVWALLAIWPYDPWVVYLNLPYLAWVGFATVLEFTIAKLNHALCF